MEALYCTAAQCVVRTGSPEGSTLLDAGNSEQIDGTFGRTSMADFVTRQKAVNIASNTTFNTRSYCVLLRFTYSHGIALEA